MPTPNSTSLNIADWMESHRRVSAADHSCPASIEVLHALVDGGRPQEALDLLDGGHVAADGPALAWARCRALWEADRWEDVRELARAIPADRISQPLNLRVLFRAAWSDLLRGDLDGEFLARVERLRPWIGHVGTLAHAADLAHLDAWRALVFADDPAAARRQARLAASLYDRLRESAAEIKARILCVRIHAIEGHLATASEEARQALSVAAESRHPRLLIQALNSAATVAWRRGDWDQAREQYESALALAEEFEEKRWRRAVEANLARLDAFEGRAGSAARRLDHLERDEVFGACTVGPVLREYRGQLCLLTGDPKAALTHFDAAFEELERSGVRSYERAELFLRKAEAWLALEEFAEARRCVDEGIELLSAYPHVLERGHLLHLRGICLHQSGRPLESARAFEEALTELRRVGDRRAVVRCLLDRIDCAAVETAVALADAGEARALAARMGDRPLADRARATLRSVEKRQRLPEPLAGAVVVDGIVATSAPMRALLAEARLAASSDHPVLLQGETGTGKEVFARFIHDHGKRKDHSFVAVNCSAIPEALFEREFFGHARGAFTGADREAPGLVEEAAGGTLFLDELGEMPASLQPKLLRLLQDGHYRRVGEVRDRRVDLRILSATNRPLRDLVDERRFREDLFYRLGWFELILPPLRERGDDLPALVRRFVERDGGQEVVLEPAAWRRLQAHSWPGNVRELEAAIGSALVRARAGGVIRPEHLPASVRGPRPRATVVQLDLSRAVRRTERELILEALVRARFRRADAARLLGIGRNTLYEKMKRLDIQPEPAHSVAG